MRYKRLLLTILLLASGVIAQSTYTPPIIPPIFSSADITSSVATFADIQAAYDTTTGLVLKHDKDLYSPTGAVGAVQSGLANVTAALNAMAKQTIIIPLNTCAPVPPLVLNANQQPIANGTYGNIGGYKMMWISNPTLETLSCPIMATKGGYYYAIGAFITPTNGHQMHIEMPVGTNVSGEIVVPNTGSWTSIFAQARSPLPIPISAGGNTIIINFEAGQFDFGGLMLQQQ